MTIPSERRNAIGYVYEFLRDLVCGKYKRVPWEVREKARRVLRHYPSQWEFDRYYREKDKTTKKDNQG